jgi:hypothetical protein
MSLHIYSTSVIKILFNQSTDQGIGKVAREKALHTIYLQLFENAFLNVKPSYRDAS